MTSKARALDSRFAKPVLAKNVKHNTLVVLNGYTKWSMNSLKQTSNIS